MQDFDVAVLDQWGVLHDGSTAYPQAVNAINLLGQQDKPIVILSNSGKRAELNRKRIAKMGLPIEQITYVVTSGEALWEDAHSDQLNRNLGLSDGTLQKTVFPICATAQDAYEWAGDSGKIEIVFDLSESVDFLMLMGLPDGSLPDAYDDTFAKALKLKIPLVCSNPDKTSPRAGGLVISPGALAERYEQMGGRVLWYGKPHASVFDAVTRCFPEIDSNRFLMVGDSFEHDIGGAQSVGMLSAIVRSGIHADTFAKAQSEQEIAEVSERLAKLHDVETPNYSLEFLA